jgi:four helix bundle protein
MTFEDLESWKEARAVGRNVYTLTRSDALARDFGLSGQIQRSSVSMMSNVAEGFERQHLQEKLQFYNVARSSCGEVRSLLYVIGDNYPTYSQEAVQLREDTAKVGKLVTGLIQSTERRRPGKILGHLLSSICQLLA